MKVSEIEPFFNKLTKYLFYQKQDWNKLMIFIVKFGQEDDLIWRKYNFIFVLWTVIRVWNHLIWLNLKLIASTDWFAISNGKDMIKFIQCFMISIYDWPRVITIERYTWKQTKFSEIKRKNHLSNHMNTGNFNWGFYCTNKKRYKRQSYSLNEPLSSRVDWLCFFIIIIITDDILNNFIFRAQ